MADWSDTPPTVPGWYWLRFNEGSEVPGYLCVNGMWWIENAPSATTHFGSRIPTNEELLAMRRELGEAKFTAASLSKLTDLLSTLSEKQAAQIAELHKEIATLTAERDAAEAELEAATQRLIDAEVT